MTFPEPMEEVVEVDGGREPGSDDIATEVSNWNFREPPPIRLIAEIVTACSYWSQTLDTVQKDLPVDFHET